MSRSMSCERYALNEKRNPVESAICFARSKTNGSMVAESRISGCFRDVRVLIFREGKYYAVISKASEI